MCREVAVLELAAPGPDIRFVQMWVCDLVMSRSFILAIPEIILFADTESIAAILRIVSLEIHKVFLRLPFLVLQQYLLLSVK